MLGNRYNYNPQTTPLYGSTPARTAARQSIKHKIDQGIYTTEKAPCPCRSTNDETLATMDRFGMPMTTVICRNCGLIRTNPRLSEKSMVGFYANEYPHLISHTTFTHNQTKYYITIHQREYHRAQHIYQLIPSSLRQRALTTTTNKPLLIDVGAGSGGMMKYFQQRGFAVLGCDYDQKAIAYGRTQNLKIILGHAGSLKAAHQADIVILSHVLEHVTNPIETIDGIANLLKPNAVLYIEVPGVLGISTHRYRNDFLRYIRFQHTLCFSLATLTNLVSSRGFKLISGTDWVKALFTYQASPPTAMASQPQEYKKIRLHLDHHERIRRFTAPYTVLADYVRHHRHSLAKPFIALGLRQPIKYFLKLLR